MEEYLVVLKKSKDHSTKARLVSWVSIRRSRQQFSKGGSVKEYVNCMSMPEYGLDCQSRHSKSCVVNNGTLSTEVLRVSIGYRSTRNKLFRLFRFRSKRCPKQWRRRTSPGSRRTNNRDHFSQYFPAVWSQPHRTILQALNLNRLWALDQSSESLPLRPVSVQHYEWQQLSVSAGRRPPVRTKTV